jgi:DNA-binding GntR family transcriptional regulator
MGKRQQSMPARAALILQEGTASHDDPTLYRRIARQLESEIASGGRPVGSLLPTEASLCSTYSASRYTIREALRVLVERGIIERRQGAGSRVISSARRATYSQTMRTLTEFSQYARDTHFDIAEVALVSVDDEAAELIPAPAGSRWMRIAGVRWNAERTERICHTTVYVHSRFAPWLHDVRTTGGPIYALVEARSGEMVAEAVQEIAARPLPVAHARSLKLRAGSPAMRLVRRYLDASGGIMLTSLNWHPADRFSYVTKIRRDDWAPNNG